MKKKIIVMILISILISCKSSKITKNDCHENLIFKERFFYHINYVDKHITVIQDSTFMKSVIFISNYAPVSTDEIMNYTRSYPLGVFQQDRTRWIQWYQENKCTNIQFKSNYFVPEVYQDIYQLDYINISN